MTDGERWVQELVARLAAERFRLRAWWRFCAESFARAAQERFRRPSAVRTTWILTVIGVAVWTAAIPAIGLWPAVASAGWWLLVAAMVRWHLGMLESPDGVPTRGIGLANVISLARLGAAPLALILPPKPLALVLVIAAGSDIADGRIARSLGSVTRLGHWVDGSADTLLLIAAATGLTIGGELAWWAGALVVARGIVPWIGLTVVYFVIRRPPPTDALVSGRAPGAVLLAGLVTTGLGVPGAIGAVVIGAAGGLATWFASSLRGARLLIEGRPDRGRAAPNDQGDRPEGRRRKYSTEP